MRRLFRDLVVGALGMNLALFGLATAMGNTDLMLLGLISMACCGLGLSFSSWVEEPDDD